MIYFLLAELLVLLHFIFILFVILGGLLLLKWPRLIWLHLPAACWGAVVELMGWICPLTPLENHFRIEAGMQGYSGDFVSRYLLPIIYPAGLTGEIQVALALFVVMINCVIYYYVYRKRGVK